MKPSYFSQEGTEPEPELHSWPFFSETKSRNEYITCWLINRRSWPARMRKLEEEMASSYGESEDWLDIYKDSGVVVWVNGKFRVWWFHLNSNIRVTCFLLLSVWFFCKLSNYYFFFLAIWWELGRGDNSRYCYVSEGNRMKWRVENIYFTAHRLILKLTIFHFLLMGISGNCQSSLVIYGKMMLWGLLFE